MPMDIQQQCLWIIRGYERCKHEYNEARLSISNAGGSHYDFSGVKQTERRRIVEDTATILAALDECPAYRQMHAVEHALDAVTVSLPDDMKDKTRKALFLSCEDGRLWPFERLDVPGLSRSGFYRLRRQMLFILARKLGLIWTQGN